MASFPLDLPAIFEMSDHILVVVDIGAYAAAETEGSLEEKGRCCWKERRFRYIIVPEQNVLYCLSSVCSAKA